MLDVKLLNSQACLNGELIFGAFPKNTLFANKPQQTYCYTHIQNLRSPLRGEKLPYFPAFQYKLFLLNCLINPLAARINQS